MIDDVHLHLIKRVVFSISNKSSLTMTQDSILTHLIKTASGHHLAWLEINQPDKLNVLNLDRIIRLEKQIRTWLDDASIAAIFISGRGSRGFCAGGDVIEVMHTAASDPTSPTRTAPFFTHEYRLDYSIHTATKPIIVLGHGIVMGGGIGLFAGASHRIVTETTVLAMPEISIGLFPDVGGSYFLNQMPGRIGRFLGLTAARMKAADAFYIGFADHYMISPTANKIAAAFEQASFTSSARQNNNEVSRILAPFESPQADLPKQSNIAKHRELIDRLGEESDLIQWAARLASIPNPDPWIAECQRQFAQGSPFSAHLIDTQLKRGQSLSLKAAFEMELILAVNVTRHCEFTTGVTSRLIDKIELPDWQWKQLDAVPIAEVERMFTPPWPTPVQL